MNKEMKKAEKKDLDDLGSFLKEMTKEISDLLEEDITKFVYKKGSKQKSIVDVPVEKPGYGHDGSIDKKGGGKRFGGKENKKDDAERKKSKGNLNILLSNHDPDPLDSQGKPFNMIERQPILFQRVKDIDHGIWWINTQKRYVRKIKIKDRRSAPFYFFLFKEIILAHRARRRFKEQEGYDPDGLEELNFNLIDEIFNKVAERVGVEFSAADQNTTDKIRESIKKRNKFTILDLTKELNLDPATLRVFIGNPENHVMESFNLKKIKSKSGRKINMYIRK